MADEGGATPVSGASGVHTCPWCSVDLGTTIPERCPSCRATLVEVQDASVPGVTAVDPEAVRRAATWQRVRRRSTFRGLLEGDRNQVEESGVQPSSLAALAPPSAELRLEMGRLRAELDAAAEEEARELEALAAEAQSNAALAAEASSNAVIAPQAEGDPAGAEAGSH